MTFSGGSYDEIERWLRNFLSSHAKRENYRAEIELDAGDEREGKSYDARLRLGDQRVAVGEFDYKTVADHRGELSWCRDLAERIRGVVREQSRSPVRNA